MIELHPGEKVLFQIRKHWLVFVFETGGSLFAALVLLLILPFVPDVLPAVAVYFSGDIGLFAVFFGCAWLLILLMGFALHLTNYYLDILIVTDWRLVDIEQLGLFSRSITNTPLQNVEDVKVEMRGLLQTFFKFGNLHVQTAAEHKEIVIHGVRRPEWVRDRIIEAHAQVAKKG